MLYDLTRMRPTPQRRSYRKLKQLPITRSNPHLAEKTKEKILARAVRLYEQQGPCGPHCLGCAGEAMAEWVNSISSSDFAIA